MRAIRAGRCWKNVMFSRGGAWTHLLPSTYLARRRHLISLQLVSLNQNVKSEIGGDSKSVARPLLKIGRKFKISQFSNCPRLGDKTQFDHESPDVIIMKCKSSETYSFSSAYIVLFCKVMNIIQLDFYVLVSPCLYSHFVIY